VRAVCAQDETCLLGLFQGHVELDGTGSTLFPAPLLAFADQGVELCAAGPERFFALFTCLSCCGVLVEALGGGPGDSRCGGRAGWPVRLSSSASSSLSSLSSSSSSLSLSSVLSPGAPNALSGLDERPVMPGAPGVAKDDTPALAVPNPPNPPPSELPNELPPNADVAEPPSDPKPLLGAVDDADVGDDVFAPPIGPAKELSLVVAAKGEPEEAARPPKGEVVEAARLPKPDALNLSSEVWGRASVLVAGEGFAAMAAKGEAADELAKPLPGGI
jgi:hypothetical protein